MRKVLVRLPGRRRNSLGQGHWKQQVGRKRMGLEKERQADMCKEQLVHRLWPPGDLGSPS